MAEYIIPKDSEEAIEVIVDEFAIFGESENIRNSRRELLTRLYKLGFNDGRMAGIQDLAGVLVKNK